MTANRNDIDLQKSSALNPQSAKQDSLGVVGSPPAALRVTRVEYTPSDATEMRTRLFRVFDLLQLDREICPPLPTSKQDVRCKGWPGENLQSSK
jgi:hypothetical protein